MILETERLILRPFAEGDAEDVYAYLSEPVVNCFASMRLNSLDAAKEEMKKRSSETEYYFAITLKDSGKVIGEIDAYPEAGEPHADETAVRDTFSPCWMLLSSICRLRPTSRISSVSTRRPKRRIPVRLPTTRRSPHSRLRSQPTRLLAV